ncbi:tyrosine-protein phosphatase non-receptor type 4 [Onthophagus taurus]|uniref:tyrosine-protein phosphatase non-receptor type 4 n=1 Tax=Onthophagus taurus TaxID=166361 RepID=UPI000C200C8F|nr:tyrosine-protein phosphatase non-receptor type 4 [Onthophagus taurus]
MIESVSRRALSGSSGTYHVQALELAAARDRKQDGFGVVVHFLDDTEHCFNVSKRSKGSALLDQVYQHLELIEKDYFGLNYYENGGSSNNKPEYAKWLDPSKSVKKQLGNNQTHLFFRVKFYVSDPSKLQEEYTRYQFYLQIRRDILEGRLQLPPSTAILLASYIVQSELGDYQPDEHGPNYLSNMQLAPNQTEEMERRISELHKLLKGQLPADAEFNFLDHAKRLEMYGVELYKAKDNSSKDIQLGVTSLGLVVFQNNVRINTFSWSKIMKISFKRKQFFIQLLRELSENYDTLLGFNMETYRASKTLWKSCVEHHTFFRLHSPKVRRRFPFSLGSKFTYSGRTEFQTVEDVKQRGKLERKFVRSPSKILIKSPPPPILEEKGKIVPAPARPPRLYNDKITSTGPKEPRKAWEDESLITDENGTTPFTPGLAAKVLSYVDEEPPSPTQNGLYDTPPYSASHSPTLRPEDDDGLVNVVLYPDSDGKYGFNVKGGATKDVPILISRVGLNTPADRCNPRLNEGDQLLQINGQDVSNALHSVVVQLIHEARNTDSGKLVLTLKPNVLYNRDDYDESLQYYMPIGDILSGENVILTPLEQSMVELSEGLITGSLLMEYEILYRKHPDMTCDEAEKANNITKNRYRDISPYDATRVILKNTTENDYINANYVNMKINGTEIINKYIATQGPLQSTTEDFWNMIYEQDCNLIVMLTTLTERGRPKCHKYWPCTGESIGFENISIKCLHEQEDSSGSFIFRDFILTENISKSERQIRHMQYVAWPDHGVPDSPIQFLDFTNRVRDVRKISPESVIVVHCSAGIGRTGVLVLMETALCLMEASQPVFPFEIVRTMRQQRAMMIQNASQYKFVCESVRMAFNQRGSEETK